MSTTSEKLSYLNETKGKIKRAINNFGGKLTNDSTFRSYPDELYNAWDNIFNQLPHVEDTSTSPSLSSTLEAPMRNLLKGNTYQTQYSGKNLLPPTIATETKNGITLTNNGDGSYTLTGTYSTSTTFDMALPATLNGTYSFSGNNPTTSNNIQFRILKSSGSPWSTYLNSVNKTYENKTIENGITQEVRIVGSFTSGFTFKPQLESGSTATSYEPYVGGVATPNPTSPTDVNVVSGDNSIIITGKNILNIPAKTKTWQTTTVNYNGTTFTVNKQATSGIGASADTDLMYWSATSGEKFTFSATYKSGTINLDGSASYLLIIYPVKKDGTNDTSTSLYITYSSATPNGRVTFTLSNDIIGFKFGWYIAGATTNTTNGDVVFDLQLEKGETTTPTYEPHNGNEYELDLRNSKNIFDISSITRGKELNGNTGKEQDNANWWLSNFITIKPSTSYTSSNISSNSKFWYDENQAFISREASTTATSPSNAKFLRVNGTLASIESNPQLMIEEGSSATTYVPYSSIELCKIGNYQDYFYKDSDKWYLHKEIGKRVFNGSELWYADGQDGKKRKRVDNILDGLGVDAYTIANILSNLYAPTTATNTYVGNMGIALSSNGKTILIYDGNYNTSDATSFKQMLANNNLVLYYALATPTTTEITDTTLINQLKEIYNAKSKENQTNISQINNDLPFIINATALLDANTYIMQLEAELEASS